MSDPPPTRPPSPRRRALEILALSSFAIAQPIFDVSSRESDFFVAHGSGRVDLLAFAAIIYVVPALLLSITVLALGRFRPTLGRLAHVVILAVLSMLALLPPLDRLGAPTFLSIAVSVLLGIALVAGLERRSGLRSFLALLAPLSIAIPLLFLFASPVSELLRSQKVAILDVSIERPVPIVMLLLDELPVVSLMDAEHLIDADLYPNFARLAASSHWFRNATAVTQNTNYAVPAILTGRYPNRLRAATAREYPRSLFPLLGGTYELEVTETQTRLCPAELCKAADEAPPRTARLRRLLADTWVVYLHIVTPQALSASLPAVTATWTDFNAVVPSLFDEGSIDLPHIFTVDRAMVFDRFVERLDSTGRPTFFFLHLMLPHVPWAYLPSGKEYWASITSSAFAEGVARDSTWTEEEWLVAQGYQRHLLQVAFVDELLGRMLDRMDETGLGDEALLIVTADHGLSFQPGQPGRRATEENYSDVMAVPLFIRTPGQHQGTVSDRNVELIDIVPTLAEIVGLELTDPIDGESVFATTPERSHKIMRTGPLEGFTLDNAALEAKYASLEHKLALFDKGLFSIGPHPELLGRPLAELRIGPPAEVDIRLDQPEHFRHVDLGSRYLPAHIFGRARWAKPPARLDLAIAVNGVVRATTRTFNEKDGERFVAMVPEQSFIPGDNAIAAFVVESSGAELTLHAATANTAPRYQMESGADGEIVALTASDGTRCRLDRTAVEGGYLREGTGLLGWASDPSGHRPYVIIMAFADGRLVHTTTTGGDPPASSPVANRAGFETAGFRFNLPSGLLESTEELRVFAVLGDRGSELHELD